MIMMGIYSTGTVPFKYVYLHGLVRDAKGQKMSKSKGNVISPLDVSNEFGTDALRMGLVVGNTPGTDLNLDPRKIGAYKKFANKLWNIARFVLENGYREEKPALMEVDRRLLDQLDATVKAVTDDLENFRFHLASEKLYHYLWDEFAAVVIEESKDILKDGGAAAESRSWLLSHVLSTSLKMLHPFMPFVTEAIWQRLPQKESELLMVAKWPREA
jgi:valyl-tRNA synthetase